MYRMSREEYQGLLRVASEQVSFGIYALEKEGYAELRHDRCESITQLKGLTRQFRAQGFRVLANRGHKEGGRDSEKRKALKE